MRLGELLVQAGVLSIRQVEQALQAQVMWGGRLGTNLVELDMLNLDVLARFIARQHGLPAAFATHFEAADRELQRKVSPALAAQYACIPLRRVGADRIAIASIAPLDGRARALIADALGTSYKNLVPAIAAELRIRYHLERVYDIARDTRFLRARKRSTVPTFEIDLATIDDSGAMAPLPAPVAEPPSDAIPEELLPDFTPRIEMVDVPTADRRRYIPTLGDSQALARIQIKSQAIPVIAPEPLDDTLQAIRRSPDRDAVARRVLDGIGRCVPATGATLLVVRGGTATSWTGAIAVPLDATNLVTQVLRHHALARATASELGPIDFLLLHELGEDDGDLVVAPILVGGHVWSVIALATRPGAPVEHLTAICNAASVAFVRLVRNANR